MQKQVMTGVTVNIDFALQEIEDIMDEAQETNHLFFSRIIGLKRSLKSIKRELLDEERAKRAST
ncbi:MAG: hypothetical protein FWE08_01960 [Oscillospiraceae bacterium]|nr:hypothetical protein [Oscillospiraceae bacterium]